MDPFDVLLAQQLSKMNINSRDDRRERSRSRERDNLRDNPKESYIVNSDPKGYMLIINNWKFKGNKQSELTMSDEDVCNLEEMATRFGYEPLIVENLTKEEFEDCIVDFTQRKRHRTVDSTIVVVLSHGGPSKDDRQSVDIITHDNRAVSSWWIIDRFKSSKCPALAKKPKILMFIACRGGKGDHGVNVRNATSYYPSSFSRPTLSPDFSNMLVIFASLPGYASFGDEYYGTFFVKEFVSVLKKRWRTKDIREIVDEASRKLISKFRGSVFEQPQAIPFGFNKKFYFERV